MNEAEKKFKNELKYEDVDMFQKKIAEEAIRKQLFYILNELNLKKGETVDTIEVADKIANVLGIQKDKEKIINYIRQLLSGKKYQYNIDSKGNIRANYSRLYMEQELYSQKELEKSNKILQEFIQRAEKYSKTIKQNKIDITYNLLEQQFSEIERLRYKVSIDIAINKVLKEYNQER